MVMVKALGHQKTRLNWTFKHYIGGQLEGSTQGLRSVFNASTKIYEVLFQFNQFVSHTSQGSGINEILTGHRSVASDKISRSV